MYFITALAVIVILKHAHCISSFDFNRDILERVINIEDNLAPVSEEYIEQPLDHFNETNNSTWKMRYFKRLDLWKPKGPIYIFINGEWKATADSIKYDDVLLITQLAQETNGALFSSEHRYYGKSMPVKTLDTSSLKYLSSQQALADLAELVKFIKSAPEFISSKVVVIGASYSANLAAWARLRYPELIDAAVASSGPVLAKKEFYEYLEVVNDDFKKYGTPDCVEKIGKIYKGYSELLETPSGIEKLKKDKDICNITDMTVTENQQLFFTRDFQSTYCLWAMSYSPDFLRNICKQLERKRWSFLGVRDSKSIDKETYCANYDFESEIREMDHYPDTMSWTYQSCTEFGYFKTTRSSKQPFGNAVPLEFYLKYCKGLFGVEFDEKRVDYGVARTNAMYGGRTPNVTNVIFTHGDMDPWHSLGVLADLSDTALVRITPGTGHCKILVDDGTTAIREDMKYVRSVIKKWIV